MHECPRVLILLSANLSAVEDTKLCTHHMLSYKEIYGAGRDLLGPGSVCRLAEESYDIRSKKLDDFMPYDALYSLHPASEVNDHDRSTAANTALSFCISLS